MLDGGQKEKKTSTKFGSWSAESMKETTRIVSLTRKVDEIVFWGALLITFLIWAFYIITNFLSFTFVACIPMIFCEACIGTNIYFFFKCSRVQKERC